MVLLKRICIVKKLLCLASPFIDRKGWESKQMRHSIRSLSDVFSWTCGVSADVLGEAELNCQWRRTCGYGSYQPAAAGTPPAARKSASIIFRAGLRAAPFGSGDGRRVRRIGAGDRWNNRRSAA